MCEPVQFKARVKAHQTRPPMIRPPPHHRIAQPAIALIITIKLIDWRNRWSPIN